ncbi:hypothetical protein [Marilutibacter spongiae]|uniref:Uncharacterized protein n=1 Tax=Marilutibacter spongiae TaxID=2025720 RepID=A0A7W3TL90_9GAMM|nr:hypothetical protein [Lysobacter spongiae]MBB1060412.1 hypothetical protein [Lysobacter spongiae]
MSLTDRLNRMEATIRQQGQQLAELAQLVQHLFNMRLDMGEAMPEDDELEPERDLDGNVYGRERDQSQSLDG